jgi:hypothetical protein
MSDDSHKPLHIMIFFLSSTVDHKPLPAPGPGDDHHQWTALHACSWVLGLGVVEGEGTTSKTSPHALHTRACRRATPRPGPQADGGMPMPRPWHPLENA